MSIPLDPASAAAFTGISITDGPGAASMSSLMASLSSEFAKSALTRNSPSTTPTANSASPTTSQSSSKKTSSASSKSSPTTNTQNTSSSNVPTTLITSVSQSSQGTSPVATDASSGTVTNAASNTSGAAITKESSCSGVSCSSGLQAAVAIPVIAAVIGILGLFFLCRRRRRKSRDEDTSMSEKPKKPAKKWSRHLRAFSFDAELLMGGRFSSSNSTRSRGAGSTRSDHNSVRSVQPSIQSIEEVAPPYRDAVSHAEAPQMSQTGTGSGVAGVASAVNTQRSRRPLTSPEPPPYGSVVTNRPKTPNTDRDPFADSHPHTPVEGSPFNDPPDDDDNTLTADSEAASIREAQIGRHLSVMSGGRTINDVSRDSSGS